MSGPELILGSTSPWRAELLARLGLPFRAISPDLDETPWMESGLLPGELVQELARAKATAVGRKVTAEALILGADQVVAIDDRVLGKPGSRDGAIEQLTLLAGRTHQLLTGLALLDTRDGTIQGALDRHLVTLRPLDRKSIENYVTREDVLGCAGSYRVEGLGISLFDSVRGDDHTAVIGLPLTQVTRLLCSVGLDPLS